MNVLSLWLRPKRTQSSTFRATILFAVFCVCLTVSLLVGVSEVYADTHGGAQVVVETENADTFGVSELNQNIVLGGDDIRVVIMKIINAVFSLLGAIAVVLIIYAGYTIMVSGGNEEKLARGKKIMTNAVAGLAIIMMAVTIVTFIIRALSDATGVGRRSGGPAIVKQAYTGSGSLGRIVTDHYPFRDQIGVKRNSMIAVTFSEPMDPSSIIENTNGSCWGPNGESKTECNFEGDTPDKPYYGDCIKRSEASQSLFDDCDHLKTNAVRIFKRDVAEGEDIVLVETAVFVPPALDDTDVKSFTFKPFDPIGDTLLDVWYTVDLTEFILKADGDNAFENEWATHYEWDFQTDTTFDFDPPYVVDVFPEPGTTETKDTSFSVTFNEPVDPSAVQGIVDQLGDSTTLDHIVFGADEDDEATEIVEALGQRLPFGAVEELELVLPRGEWTITNGYKTIEFRSFTVCAQNSCGQDKFCVDLACEDQNDISCTNDFTTLLRTAELINPDQTFEGFPGTGIMDMSSNALDANKNKEREGKPPLGNVRVLDEEEKIPDNYFWSFTIKNEVDNKAPYIQQVDPGLDEGSVGQRDPITVQFNKRMIIGSLRALKVEEYPANLNDVDDFGGRVEADNIEISDEDEKQTLARFIPNRILGPNDIDLYYFVSASSSVLDVKQNCMYPGYGPDADARSTGPSPICTVEYNEEGDVEYVSNTCIPKSITPRNDQDSGCEVVGGNLDDKLQPNLSACLDYMKRDDVSPRLDE